jgi:hypothetical protein
MRSVIRIGGQWANDQAGGSAAAPWKYRALDRF